MATRRERAKARTFKCKACGRKINPVENLVGSGVCGSCVRKRHRQATR